MKGLATPTSLLLLPARGRRVDEAAIWSPSYPGMEEAELLQRMGFTFKDLSMVYGGVYMGSYGFLIIK